MSLENRVDKIEVAILIMKDLPVSHNDRLDDYYLALENERRECEESRKDFEFKLNALINSQMRTESELIELKEASQSHLKRIVILENK